MGKVENPGVSLDATHKIVVEIDGQPYVSFFMGVPSDIADQVARVVRIHFMGQAREQKPDWDGAWPIYDR